MWPGHACPCALRCSPAIGQPCPWTAVVAAHLRGHPQSCPSPRPPLPPCASSCCCWAPAHRAAQLLRVQRDRRLQPPPPPPPLDSRGRQQAVPSIRQHGSPPHFRQASMLCRKKFERCVQPFLIFFASRAMPCSPKEEMRGKAACCGGATLPPTFILFAVVLIIFIVVLIILCIILQRQAGRRSAVSSQSAFPCVRPASAMPARKCPEAATASTPPSRFLKASEPNRLCRRPPPPHHRPPCHPRQAPPRSRAPCPWPCAAPPPPPRRLPPWLPAAPLRRQVQLQCTFALGESW